MSTTRVTDMALIDRLWARAGKWERHFNGDAEWFCRRGTYRRGTYLMRCRWDDCLDLGDRVQPVLYRTEFYRVS